jgi:Helix-hairpin-helix motif
LISRFAGLAKLLAISPEKGAETIIYLASSPKIAATRGDISTSAARLRRPGGAGRQDCVIALGAQRGVSGPECVDASRWDCTLEPLEGTNRHAVRLGLRMVRGLANKDGAAIVAARAGTPFATVEDLWRRSNAHIAALEHCRCFPAFARARTRRRPPIFVKLSGNFLIAALVGKGGIDKRQYLDILTSTLFGAPDYKTRGRLIADGIFEPAGFAAPLGQKDIRLPNDGVVEIGRQVAI